MEQRLREAKRIYDQLNGERPGNLKSRILQTLSSTNEVPKRRTSSKPWLRVASTTLVVFVLAGVILVNKSVDATMATALDLDRALSKQPTASEQRKVWSLMYHAIDHFSTVQGDILYHFQSGYLRADFGEELRPRAQGYDLIVNTNTGKLATEEIVKGGYSLNIDLKEHVATRLPWVYSPFQLPKNLPIPNTFHEADPVSLDLVRDLTNPFEYLQALMNDFSHWRIDGTSTHFGRPVYEISGAVSSEYQVKWNGATSYTLVVDKETGVVFDLELINPDGQVVAYERMDSVVFNQPIQENKLNQTLPPGIKLVQ